LFAVLENGELSDNKKNQLVVITGVSSGMGLAMANALLVEGYSVFGIARNIEKANIQHPNFNAKPIDLADIDALPENVADLVQEINMPVKALINNAGIGRMGFLEQLSVKDIRLVMDTNFISQTVVTKAFLPLLKRQGWGDLVFMGSEAALQGARQGSIYCASKFAVRGFAQALREECGKSGLRVTLINPGAVRTAFFDDLHFEPGPDAENAIEVEDVVKALLMVLQASSGTVFDEINISPRSHVWKKK
jgi:short-subunit dehydrogenase